MKMFALTLLSLLAVSQARLDYKLQCTRDEIGIRWPSYFSNSEYYVCQSVFGSQLTVHCPPGEVFTFVLQQCAVPALYVPAPPMDVLPTGAPITTHLIDDLPPVLGPVSAVHGHELLNEPHVELEEAVHALPSDPTPPTPPTEAPTPPTVVVDAPKPAKKPVAPVLAPAPSKASAPKKPSVPAPAKASAKKPAAPAPSKSAKKPTPPSKAQKKPSA